MARSFTYDAENRQVTECINCTQGSPTTTYVYDGEGQRVGKTVNGQTTTYVYDAFGNLAAEYGGGPTSACGTPTRYVTTDHLGSTRLLTSNTGGVGARYDYEPFGQEIGAGYDGRLTAMGFTAMLDDTNPKFTGQMRDPETTTADQPLDFFNVRYFSGAPGRFQSPDPGNAGADPSNPQTWNMYAYVGNNPLSYTDPSGESFWSVLGGIFSGLGTFLATGNPFLGAEVGLGVNDTIDSLQNGQFPLAGLLDFAGIPVAGDLIGDLSGGVNSGPWNEQPPWATTAANPLRLPSTGFPGMGGITGIGNGGGPWGEQWPGSNGFLPGLVPVAAGVGEIGLGALCVGSGVCEAIAIGGAVAAVGAGAYVIYRKTTKASGKEKTSDAPSYTAYHPNKGPNETCAQYAARVVLAQFGAGDPRAQQRGPGSDYSKIKKACERGGL
ncbi:MAG TPA: RHS repeat-associated core domain-containing protein [Bryobacteraceae bacterium]|nr:RHS repeat-associated core domain-containing protein [Bryobacteraceae bacterium]